MGSQTKDRFGGCAHSSVARVIAAATLLAILVCSCATPNMNVTKPRPSAEIRYNATSAWTVNQTTGHNGGEEHED